MTPGYEAIRDAFVRRHRREDGERDWDVVRPAVLDIAAEVMARLHLRLSGRVSEIRSVRPAKYLREQLRGEKCTLVEDLALYALDEPEAFAAALTPLLEAAGYLPPEPTGRTCQSLTRAASSFTRTAGAAVSETLDALEDGDTSRAELDRIERRLDAHDVDVATLKRAVALRKARSRR
jgi:hypothetical protein